MSGNRRSRGKLSYELTYVIYIGSEKLQTSLGGRIASFMGIKHFMQQIPGNENSQAFISQSFVWDLRRKSYPNLRISRISFISDPNIFRRLWGDIEKVFWALNTLCNSFTGIRTPKPIFQIVLFETYVESVTYLYDFHVYPLYRIRVSLDVFGGT